MFRPLTIAAVLAAGVALPVAAQESDADQPSRPVLQVAPSTVTPQADAEAAPAEADDVDAAPDLADGEDAAEEEPAENAVTLDAADEAPEADADEALDIEVTDEVTEEPEAADAEVTDEVTEEPEATDAEVTGEAAEEPEGAEGVDAAEPGADEAVAEESDDAAEDGEETSPALEAAEQGSAEGIEAGEEHAAEGHEDDEAHSEGGHDSHVVNYDFSFEGPFGAYDQMQLQRGLQVYTEVCSACHGLRYVPFRTLSAESGPGLPEDQVRAYAAFYEVFDPDLDNFRTATPPDHFPPSALENAPDLSLMAKSRTGFHGPAGTGISQFVNGIGGPEYVATLLTHYTGEEYEQAGTILYGNETFPGGRIAMPPPLSEGLVEYEDGTPATVEQMALDVTAFMMWTAEPKLMERKRVGFVAVIFLGLFAVLLYLTNKRVWAPIKHRYKGDGDA
ncbi:cytochrome c1 [Roseicyclus sp. F158]|uniref:Cytochrome c1 n=1 Tax=Tropicimonas omnivorans TaxID=3075590 RepID=A0ABU3DCH4_9RHOB|nr:cytochrome c1 [Roseicyclus sp. F158]MDT0681254.1 cytochrome c1 [Roseicyclus sp. F158]